MEFSARKIAEILNGTIEGNPDVSINQLSKIEEGDEGTLTFLANPKYTNFIYSTKASVVIVDQSFIPEKPIKCTLIKVDDPYSAFAKLLEAYNTIKLNKIGISDKAFISKNAKLGNDVYIGEFAIIGEKVSIGDNSKIYPGVIIGENVIIDKNTTLFYGVKIYSDNKIGKNCTLHAGVIVGGDGFGFAPQDDNNYKKIAQIGNVIIKDNVEIGANSTIDRATLGSTIINKGVKLDNLIQIAHNVEIGENTVMAALAGVSGSTKIGKNCMVGGQTGFAGHLTIGNNVKVAAQSGVASNFPDDSIIMGAPAYDAKECRKSFVHIRNLSKYAEKIKELEKNIEELKQKIE